MDAEVLAKASYGKTRKERQVKGYKIVDEFTTDDRVVYQKDDSGHITIAFRGTDPGGFEYLDKDNPWRDSPTDYESWRGKSKKDFIQTGLKSLWYSRSFRDISTDVEMVFDTEQHFSRFKNAQDVTRRVIQKYGKENVNVVGHSLGGSQAMDVSKKYGVQAVAINPFVHPTKMGSKYPNVDLIYNISDPVSIFSPFVKTHSTRARYYKHLAPTVPQHSLSSDILDLHNHTPEPVSIASSESVPFTFPTYVAPKRNAYTNVASKVSNYYKMHNPDFVKSNAGVTSVQ